MQQPTFRPARARSTLAAGLFLIQLVACHGEPPQVPAPPASPPPIPAPAQPPPEPPPDVPPRADGLGSSRAGLPPDLAAKVAQGRQLFMTAMTPERGLGPHFNDVSCLACHGDPIAGGFSSVKETFLTHTPRGPKIQPQKTVDGFAPVPTPPPDASRRRPPPLFGLGLVEAVPDDVIIRGCQKGSVPGHANVRPDGHVGRFGSKPFHRTIRAFTGDALDQEMGMTVPEGEEDGEFHDSDSVPDPELSHEDVADIALYVSWLAPPPRNGTNPAGEKVFARVGCAACHRPNLSPDLKGVYSDLCEHRMGSDLADGFDVLQTTGDEFRTTPLWGLHYRTSYLHDGRAHSIDDAVKLHGGAAAPARAAYDRLKPADRASLQAFLQTL